MKRYLMGIALLLGANSFAMEVETVSVTVWHRGEVLEGEQFLPANEGVVDYLTTVPRPALGALKGFTYQCHVKRHSIQSPVLPLAASAQYVSLTMVYELKDCARTE